MIQMAGIENVQDAEDPEDGLYQFNQEIAVDIANHGVFGLENLNADVI